jgi:hypothetical protein
MPEAKRHSAPSLFDGGSEDITIAILDGNVLTTHESLREARLDLLGAAPADTTQAAANGTQHGTAIASLLFGQPGSNATGFAWRCKGLVRPIYRDGPDGIIPASQEDLATAIREVIAAGADIINISGGELAGDKAMSPELATALAEAEEADVLVIAATGNDGCDCAHFPAVVESVLAVGAVDIQGMALPSSNFGAHYATHGIVAQGAGMAAAATDGSVIHPQGTSMATAVVSGAAALLMAAGRRAGQRFGAKAIKHALIAGAQSATGPDAHKFLAGRIDLSGALARLLPSVSSPQPPQKKEEVIMTQLEDSEYAGEVQIMPAAMAGPASQPQPQKRGLLPSEDADCPTCQKGGGDETILVYALGTLSFDAGTETRRAGLIQNSDIKSFANDAAVIATLKKDPKLAASLTWTFLVDDVPIYAIRPGGAFAAEGYKVLVDMLEQQGGDDAAERLSLPGIVTGNVLLSNGMVVPIVTPEQQGMYNWNTKELVKSLVGTAKGDEADQRQSQIGNFLDRVYFELRNIGQAPQDRAINFAATQAQRTEKIFEKAISAKLQLDNFSVERSPIARPGTDCWDVKLVFFNPMKRLEEANLTFRFTIDVSDVIPVMVGKVRSWYGY